MPEKETSPKTEERPSEFQAYKCYITFNPDAVLSGGFELEEKIIDDLKRFDQRELQRPRTRIPGSASKRVAVDTEYDPSSKLLTLGVATARDAIAYEVA